MFDQDLLCDRLGREWRIRSVQPLGGGCISAAHRVSLFTDDGQTQTLMVKQNSAAFLENFQAEMDGLHALGRAGGIRIPKPVDIACSPTQSILVMEWIDPGTPTTSFYAEFGTQLANLHLQTRVDDTEHGWPTDNYLGSSTQCNQRCSTWPEFVAEKRLGHQLKLAVDQGVMDSTLHREVEQLIRNIDERLAGRHPGVGLLHGDLWSGNYLCDSEGRATLIDPAVYRGCAEAEFGMIELFGACPRAFYDAYLDTNPLADGWQKRVRIYVLYHLLNHLNLFGDGYRSQCRTVTAQILRDP